MSDFYFGHLQPTGRELQYGRVSAAELVQAVHEMLSAAGISMDVEKQFLMQKTISLQEQLQDSRAELLLEQVCDCTLELLFLLFALLLTD